VDGERRVAGAEPVRACRDHDVASIYWNPSTEEKPAWP
jgi:hypothetical protein